MLASFEASAVSLCGGSGRILAEKNMLLLRAGSGLTSIQISPSEKMVYIADATLVTDRIKQNWGIKLPIIVAGTKVLTAGTNTSLKIFSNAEVNSLLDVTNSSNANTVCLFTNGDGVAQSLHIEGATYQSGIWYAVFDRKSEAKSLRINYVIFYFG